MTHLRGRFAAHLLAAAAAVCLALGAAAPARAASVLPLYLEEIIDSSAVAFEGRCIGNRTERDPATQLVVTYTTFEVLDALKGPVGATHEIKQVGGTLDSEGIRYQVQGVPAFTMGERYVVFLAGVSSAGFSSPIGLAQGRFGVHGEAGARRVGNGRDFRDMAARIAAQLPPAARARVQQDAGPVRELDLDDFKLTVRNRVGGKR